MENLRRYNYGKEKERHLSSGATQQQSDMAETNNNLKGSQRFFALVYQLRECEKAYLRTHKEIKAIEATGLTEEHSNLAQLKEQKDKLFKNAEGIRRLVDMEIERAEKIYEQNKITPFWR